MRPLRLRPILVFLLASSCLAPAAAAQVSLVRVWSGYRTAASFDRISEYFNGRENTGPRTVLRTQPAERGGFYFLAHLHNSGPAVAGASFELTIITAVSAEPKSFVFTAMLPAGDRVFDLGLTGTDWPEAKAHPVAWKLTIHAPGGAELASEQSYLWEKPAGKN